MVEIIEIDNWRLNFDIQSRIWVKSLDDLMKMADIFKEPFIMKKGKKEYAFCHDNIIYSYQE